MNADGEIAQLRSRVAQIEAQLAFLYAHLGVTYVPDPDIINQPVIDLLKTGNYMDAMKAYGHPQGIAQQRQSSRRRPQ
jgi:hypothetical protein